MHSSGSMTKIRSASWMQSTGQTSTHDRSLISMQGSAMMYVIALPRSSLGGLLYRGNELLDDLRSALLERVLDDHLVEAGLVCSPQSGCIGVAAEADDGHIDVRVRDLLGIDTRDVGNDEIGPIDAVARHEVVRREERLQLGAEKSVDPTQQYRRHGENVPPVTACLQGSVSRW